MTQYDHDVDETEDEDELRDQLALDQLTYQERQLVADVRRVAQRELTTVDVVEVIAALRFLGAMA